MKYLTLAILAALTLTFGACASKDDSSTSASTHSAGTTSYSK